MKKTFLFLVRLMCCCTLVAANEGNDMKSAPDACTSIERCGICIAAGCSWCSDSNYSGPRCDTTANLTMNGTCAQSHISYSQTIITDNENIPPKDSDDGLNTIQLAPQNITIRMRPGSIAKFNVTFRLAANYPVDLYFVIDVSNSMKQLMNRLVSLSDVLASSLYNLTKNYQLGLGTYMEKTTMPFINMENLEWCKNCGKPYTFRNYLPLTRNISSFKSAVESVENSGNWDAPEALLDALVQALACKTEVGWRDQSRKLIVVSTDSIFHVSGEGLLGGALEPNDLQCYCQNETMAQYFLVKDYPSVSQLAREVVKKAVNVIFAIPENYNEAIAGFRRLAANIQGSSVGVLSSGFTNVVELIKENYQSLSSSVKLGVESSVDSNDVSVTFRSSCLGNVVRDTPQCDNLGLQQSVTFEVNLKLLTTTCPADRSKWQKVIQISPVGLAEKLTVNIQLDCECGCEQMSKQKPLDARCSNNGVFTCGQCDCNDDFYGASCSCSKKTDDVACKMTSNSTKCGEHGDCYCGACTCHEIPGKPDKRYSGKFCECDDFTCDYFEGELCGGERRGRCSCGRCECIGRWTGERCNCNSDEAPCKAKNNKTCNAKGKCECGICVCDDPKFTGTTCEECPTCRACERHHECVKCKFEGDCKLDCQTKVKIFYDEAEYDSVIKKPSEVDGCGDSVQLENGCKAEFVYSSADDEIKAKKTCPTPQNQTLTIIIGVASAILAVFLGMLFTWKACVTFHDRREYAKFEEERLKEKFQQTENPIYKNPISTVSNPVKS